ncbi:MAG: DUF4382 domain-containing protein [Acidobacteriia bacterium]|nr:DUF4382 domain-containing protein [Terriglobia bacterium]
MASISTSVSDPAPCGAPQGPFSHVYVTITDVEIHQSADAAPSDAGWVDLTPSLKSNPKQVDLLEAANNQCFLATLGSNTEIQPGTYQQIRVFLAANGTTVAGNQCGVAVNCVMLTSDPSNTPFALQLSSESQTGIKIPSGQIAGGKFQVAAGDVKDLNIDFNACASIVTQGNGMYRLKPVLHGAEASLTSASIQGTVVDSAGAAIVGGNTVVALEQNDGTGVDRVIMETVTDANGNFVFCPAPSGTFDVVISAINGAGTAYAATVITGVQSGNGLGHIPMTTAGAPASITGQITTTTGSAATAADLQLSALQPITENSATVMITTPLAQQSAATATLTTVTGTCPTNTDCASYTLSVPASNPSVGAFSTSGNQTPGPPASGAVNYTVDAVAFAPGSSSTLDCSPSDLQTSPLAVTAGNSFTAATLKFTSCQ